MRIVFFGSSDLGYACCQQMLADKHDVVGIFTIPKEFNISYSKDKPVTNYLHRDFDELGEEFDIPVFQVNQNLKDYKAEFEGLKPDFLIAVGWYYMIPGSWLKLLDKGAAGIHGSLLPKYRGNAPLVWAVLNGETETGVSFFYFSKGVDEGDIIAQIKFDIQEEDTIKDVLDKTKETALKILSKNIPLIANGTANLIKQDHSKATMYPNRTPEDGLINWEWSAKRIKNFIRAQTKPYPGAFTYINNKKVTIWDADIYDDDNSVPPREKP